MFDGCYSEASVIGKCRNNKRGAAPLFHTVKKGTPTYPAERRPEDTKGQWDVPGAFTAHTTNGSRTQCEQAVFISARRFRVTWGLVLWTFLDTIEPWS